MQICVGTQLEKYYISFDDFIYKNQKVQLYA